MQTGGCRVTIVLGLVVAVAAVASAESRKEMRFPVGRKALVSITNDYGPIIVKPSATREVVITTTVYSDKVDVAHSQHGRRIDFVSYPAPGADAQSGRVDYEVAVPPDTSLTLRTTSGTLSVEKLHSDVSLEETAGEVDVRDFSGSHIHVHVKTLDGPVVLTNVHDAHVDISSIGGNVTLNEVTGTLVQVSSTSGNIQYDGDFGAGGEYILTSHTGNIDAIAPAYASFDVMARSVQGEVEDDFQLEPEHIPFMSKAGSAFAGTMNRAASTVKLLTFSGRIHLKKRH
jgi:DUF4097 and DUF4098 domain-containing protein YvlB